MSYREIRNLTETLRALGFPAMVSMESFRTPNFALVADLLVWLAKRFDPDADIALEIEDEEDRVALIRNVAQFMVLKGNIKLNTKRLYQADGYAVKELLKITTLLYEALRQNFSAKENDEEGSGVSLRDFDISDKVNELKQSRQLASEITLAGARLHDLLAKEVDLRSARHISAGRQYEVSDVEVGIKQSIESIKKEIAETKQLIENVSANEASLDSKIERRKAEIDRYEKRLQTLKKVRPAFLEEFTELEGELEKLFMQYAVRVRTLNHLENLASNAERAYLEKQQIAASQKVAETIPPERVDPATDLLSFDENIPEAGQEMQVKQERPRARTGGRSRAVRTSKVFGGLNPLGSVSGSEDESETDTDDLLLDGEDPEIPLHSDDDSLGLELSEMERLAPTGRKTSSKMQSNSDDDF